MTYDDEFRIAWSSAYDRQTYRKIRSEQYGEYGPCYACSGGTVDHDEGCLLNAGLVRLSGIIIQGEDKPCYTCNGKTLHDVGCPLDGMPTDEFVALSILGFILACYVLLSVGALIVLMLAPSWSALGLTWILWGIGVGAWLERNTFK